MDLDPTWVRIQPLCGSGSKGPYSATLWIWSQLGFLFSHLVDMDPTWARIQPLCGYGSNLGPYSATLWIWIQLGSLFSHFEDLDPTWVLIQPILVTALPCHKTLPFTPSKWPLLKVLFRYSLARLKGHLAVNRESILYASWPCSPTLPYHTPTTPSLYTTTCQFPANHSTPSSI